jgi:hypothetical protein
MMKYKKREPHLPSCLLAGVFHLSLGLFAGDNHHKDPVVPYYINIQ